MLRHFLARHGSKVAAGCAAAAAALAGGGWVQASADVHAEEPLCIDKLACHRHVAPPRTPAVLVSCGSFNPPTLMHLRMFDLATAALAERGYDVWGCYMSPVADAYGKQGLAPVHHRVAMCRAAAEGTDNIMVDTWEAAQPGYTRTLQVLRHVASALQAYMQPQPSSQQQQQQQQQPPAAGDTANVVNTSSSSSSSSGIIHAHGLAAAAAAAANLSATADHASAKSGTAASSSSTAGQANSSSSSSVGAAGQAVPAPRVMLLCGADLLATINQPGVWKDQDLILQEHGIVCVVREGTDIGSLLQQPGGILHKYRDNVVVVQEPVANSISSTVVRRLVASGQPVRHLVPDGVLGYIQEHGLYGSSSSNNKS